MAAQSEAQTTEMDPIKAYAEYRFDEDETYQVGSVYHSDWPRISDVCLTSCKQGLASILAGSALDASAADEAQDEMIRKTRVFYFNKCVGASARSD